MSLVICGQSTTVTISLYGDPTHLGCFFHSNLRTPIIQECEHGTPASNIKQWRSRLRNATIQAVNGEIMGTIEQFQLQFKDLRNTHTAEFAITIAQEDFGNLHTAQGLPQMHFNPTTGCSPSSQLHQIW